MNSIMLFLHKTLQWNLVQLSRFQWGSNLKTSGTFLVLLFVSIKESAIENSKSAKSNTIKNWILQWQKRITSWFHISTLDIHIRFEIAKTKLGCRSKYGYAILFRISFTTDLSCDAAVKMEIGLTDRHHRKRHQWLKLKFTKSYQLVGVFDVINWYWKIM